MIASPPNLINDRQNQPELIDLLKAADAAYVYARRADLIRTTITLASLAMAILATFRNDLVDLLAVTGAGGAVVNELVRRLATLRWTRMGMLFQEWFDTTLFGLKWNPSVGKRPREEDRHYWERRFHGDIATKQNWYVDVRRLPVGHAVLLCQRENLSWDSRLRRLWGNTLLLLAVAWIGIGVWIGIAGDWKVWDLVVRWLAPSAPAMLFAIGSGLQHRHIAEEKDALINRIEDLLGAVLVRSTAGAKRLLDQAREFQDVIAGLRADETRVPGWLYRWFRGEYEDAAATAAQRWREQLLRDIEKQDGSRDEDESPVRNATAK